MQQLCSSFAVVCVGEHLSCLHWAALSYHCRPHAYEHTANLLGSKYLGQVLDLLGLVVRIQQVVAGGEVALVVDRE